jgi:hypothetical protein
MRAIISYRIPILALVAVAALVSAVALAPATENITGRSTGTTFSGFIPLYGSGTPGAIGTRPSDVWVVGNAGAAIGVSGWRHDGGGSWVKVWPKTGATAADTTDVIAAGAVRHYKLNQTDALYISGAAAQSVTSQM